MEANENITLVAPCGIYCGDCPAYLANANPALLEHLVAKGFKREKFPCAGCRPLKGNCPAIESTCETYTCAAKHEINFCFECPEFPCAKLNPAADRADILPHNLKTFNLCYIQNQGLDKWLEKASEIKQRYYRGIMEIGRGPQLK